MSSKELARLLGVGGPFLSMLEHGRREPSFEMVLRIAELLGIDPGFALETALRERLPESQRALVPSMGASELPAGKPTAPQFSHALGLQRRHAELEFDRVEIDVRVLNDQGDVEVVRRWMGCKPSGDTAVMELTFRERVPTPGPIELRIDPSSFRLLSTSTALRFEGPIEQLVVEREHRMLFRQGWRSSGLRGTGLSFESTSRIDKVYRYDERDVSRGCFNYHLPFVTKSLQLSVVFPDWYYPASAEPWAWFGRGSIQAVARNIQSEGVCRSIRAWRKNNRVRLTVNAPLAGYTYAVVWIPPDRQSVIQARARATSPAGERAR